MKQGPRGFNRIEDQTPEDRQGLTLPDSYILNKDDTLFWSRGNHLFAPLRKFATQSNRWTSLYDGIEEVREFSPSSKALLLDIRHRLGQFDLRIAQFLRGRDSFACKYFEQSFANKTVDDLRLYPLASQRKATVDEAEHRGRLECAERCIRWHQLKDFPTFLNMWQQHAENLLRCDPAYFHMPDDTRSTWLRLDVLNRQGDASRKQKNDYLRLRDEHHPAGGDRAKQVLLLDVDEAEVLATRVFWGIAVAMAKAEMDPNILAAEWDAMESLITDAPREEIVYQNVERAFMEINRRTDPPPEVWLPWMRNYVDYVMKVTKALELDALMWYITRRLSIVEDGKFEILRSTLGEEAIPKLSFYKPI